MRGVFREGVVVGYSAGCFVRILLFFGDKDPMYGACFGAVYRLVDVLSVLVTTL